jgi:uncharacterized protein (DUF58 family)
MGKKLEVDYARALSQFERAVKKFQVKKIIYKSLFRAKGLEFESYRSFDPDDDATRIDWKASLRANELLVRKYIEERALDIYFVIDSSSNMLFGSGKKLKAEYIAEISIALSHLIFYSDDNPGLVMFKEKVSQFIKPSRGRNQLQIFAKFLLDSGSYGGAFDLKNALEYLLRKLKSPFSVVILISDFIHLKKGFERDLKILTSKFETIAFMIRDELDDELPKTDYQIILQDPNSDRQLVVNPSVTAGRYKQNAARQKMAVKELMKQSGVDILELNTKDSFVIPLISFLKSRASRG